MNIYKPLVVTEQVHTVFIAISSLFLQTDYDDSKVSEESTKKGDYGQAWEKRLADKDGFFTLTNYLSGKILTPTSNKKLEIKGMHVHYIYMNHKLKDTN